MLPFLDANPTHQRPLGITAPAPPATSVCAVYFCTSDPLPITIAITPFAIHFVHSILPESRHCNQFLCVQHLRHHSPLCVPPSATTFRIIACGFSFCTRARKPFVHSTPWQLHHRNQCLCVPVCAFHPPAINTVAITACVTNICVKNHSPMCVFHLPSISIAMLANAVYFCTNEQKSLCIPPISHRHRDQCLCIPVCAFLLLSITQLPSALACPACVRNHC